MWWIGIVLIEAVGFLLVWRLLLTAAPKSEKERCYEDEAQVRALANWRASGWQPNRSTGDLQCLGRRSRRRIFGSSLIRYAVKGGFAPNCGRSVRHSGHLSGPPAEPAPTCPHIPSAKCDLRTARTRAAALA
jgi:hypothetical protein